MRPARSMSRAGTLGLLAVLAVTALPLGASPQPAAAGPRLTVSPSEGLDPAGHRVTVRGEGYDESKGIYVVWCLRPPPGEKPTPCGGGQDRQGTSGNSVWVSSFPPAYGLGLAEPYDAGGSFEVEITVSRHLNDDIDCFEVECVVATRNDHERPEDRSQDVFVPVRFRGQPEPAAAAARPSRSSAPSGAGPAEPATPSRPAPSSPRPTPAPEGAMPTAEQPSPSPTEAPDEVDDLGGAVVVRGPDHATPTPRAAESDGHRGDTVAADGTLAERASHASRTALLTVAALAVLASAGALLLGWRLQRGWG